MALSLEAALCAVISSDCINKEARGISIALQIMIMKKKKKKDKTGLVLQSRQTHLDVSGRDELAEDLHHALGKAALLGL